MRKQNRPADGDDEWTLCKPDLSLAIWKAMEATDWQHLPFPGNLLDQPDWWIHDAFTLSWRKQVLRDQMKAATARSAFGKPRVAFGD